MQFRIPGPQKISGTYTPQGNKNEALPVLAASLLGDAPVLIRQVPNIRDVLDLVNIMQILGADVTLEQHQFTMHSAQQLTSTPDEALASRIRASLLLAPPLLHRTGRFRLHQPGGDRIGRRRIDTHLELFRRFGARFEEHPEHLDIILKQPVVLDRDLYLDEASVMATENALMLAAVTPARTVIGNAASEPHVQQLALLLKQMGADIDGIGTNRITVVGQSHLGGATHRILEDHIEVGSIVSLAAASGSAVIIDPVTPDIYRNILPAFQTLGVETMLTGHSLMIPDQQDLRVRPDQGGQIPRLHDAPWPGFPADLTSMLVVLATQAAGAALIHEWMFESRLYWVDSLIAMGARIVQCDPHRVVTLGKVRLHGSQLTSPDIRAGMALLIAGMIAEGETVIRNIQQIDRGYEAIDSRINALGGHIQRED